MESWDLIESLIVEAGFNVRSWSPDFTSGFYKILNVSKECYDPTTATLVFSNLDLEFVVSIGGLHRKFDLAKVDLPSFMLWFKTELETLQQRNNNYGSS